MASLRGELGRHPHDRQLAALVQELRNGDEQVARWWDDHRVRDYTSVAKQIDHPVAGNMSFELEIVAAPHEPDQRLVVYTAQPDSVTARKLPLLRSWTSDQDPAAVPTGSGPAPDPE